MNQSHLSGQLIKMAVSQDCLTFFIQICRQKAIFQQNHFSLLISGPSGLDSWSKKAKNAGLGIRSSDFRANRLFFAQKWANERFAQKMSDSQIRSFLVSDLSNSLTITHFLWATRANRSWSLIFGERPKRFAHITHFWWATWAIHSHRSPKKRKWAIRSLLQ